MTFKQSLIGRLEASIEAKTRLLSDLATQDKFDGLVSTLVEAYRQGGRLYIAGNGGSAADAQHLAAEFVCRFAKDRNPLPAESLSSDTSILTAIGNDYGFKYIFSRQLEAKATTKDVFLAISTSGKSANILEALKVCRSKGVYSILLSGKNGGEACCLADVALLVPGESVAVIQEIHLLIEHAVCACVEHELFS